MHYEALSEHPLARATLWAGAAAVAAGIVLSPGEAQAAPADHGPAAATEHSHRQPVTLPDVTFTPPTTPAESAPASAAPDSPSPAAQQPVTHRQPVVLPVETAPVAAAPAPVVTHRAAVVLPVETQPQAPAPNPNGSAPQPGSPTNNGQAPVPGQTPAESTGGTTGSQPVPTEPGKTGPEPGTTPEPKSAPTPPPKPSALCRGVEGLSIERQKALCAVNDELAKWQSGQIKPGLAGYAKYSENHREYWCADFAWWIWRQANDPLRADPNDRVFRVTDIMNIGKEETRFHWHPVGSYTPRPGDMAIHKGPGVSHVNFVASVHGTTVVLEGGDQDANSLGYPDGSVVSSYTIHGFNEDSIIGYVSPD